MILLSGTSLLRVVFSGRSPIVAVLGSISAGSPTRRPRTALGAAGASCWRPIASLKGRKRQFPRSWMGRFALVIMILSGVNFDLRITREVVPFEDWVA